MNQVFNGQSCPVCDQLFNNNDLGGSRKQQLSTPSAGNISSNHDHVVCHFIEELRELIQAAAFHNDSLGNQCMDCDS